MNYILLWLILIFLVAIFYLIFFRENIIKKQNSYTRKKIKILKKYTSSELLDIFNNKDKLIDISNIDSIEKRIVKISKKIQKLQKIFIYLQDKKDSIEDAWVVEFIDGEKEWIMKFSLAFLEKLKKYLLSHNNELLKLSDSFNNKSGNSKAASFKLNLELHERLIKKQIKIIKKI